MITFIKKHVVLAVAFCAALISAFFVHPDKAYLNYFDYKTLSCLFMTLAVVCALRNIMFFTILSRKIVKMAGNLRLLAIYLVIITFVGSMLIANDMALITFLPLGYMALDVTKNDKYAAYIFILQNISANLGGMILPFGNPQNLYLYSYFYIPTKLFTSIMFPPFLVSVVMLVLCCCFLPKTTLNITDDFDKTLDKKKTIIYLFLFAVSILCVFRVINYIFATILILISLLFMDRQALRDVDYALLLTFSCFFIFSGNLARISAINTFASNLLSKSPLLVTIASCQIISNVPTAILLSKFTTNYRQLLLGVNIGGAGTLISSLASLITFSEYRLLYPGHTKHYLKLFAILNIIFLFVLTFLAYFYF